MTEVGCENSDIVCPKSKTEFIRYESYNYIEEEFQSTEIFAKLGNYKDLTQLQLSKSIPK